jgi:hypothetical protein
VVGDGADLGPALCSGHAAAGRGVAGVLLVLVAVAHVLVPHRQRAAPSLGPVGAVQEPQAGGEVLRGAAQQGPGAGGVDLAGHRQAAQRVGVGQARGVGGADQVSGRVDAKGGHHRQRQRESASI